MNEKDAYIEHLENTIKDLQDQVSNLTEYSCAAELPVRCGVSHLSRRNEPLYN